MIMSHRYHKIHEGDEVQSWSLDSTKLCDAVRLDGRVIITKSCSCHCEFQCEGSGETSGCKVQFKMVYF